MKALCKLLVFLLILGAAGYLLYRYRNPPLSAQEQIVKAWDDEFKTASSLFVGQRRLSGGTQLSMSTDIDTAISKIRAIWEDVQRKKGAITDEKAVRRVEELEAKIREFMSRNQIELK